MTKFTEPKINLWVEQDGELILGSGRIQLLLLINELGSLNKAADSLGMSYRSAWGKLKRTEEILGFKLVEKSNSRREGYTLSEKAVLICHDFIKFKKEVQEYSEQIYKNYPILLELCAKNAADDLN